MNLQRINQLYNQPELLAGNTGEVESLRQLCRDYPYYARPYVILARHYYNTQHYKFDETLRQAALRVRDRQALYDYIHGKIWAEATAPEAPVTLIQEAAQTDSLVVPETPGTVLDDKPGLQDFLEAGAEAPAAIEAENPEQVHAEEFTAALEELETGHSFEPHADKPVEFEFSGFPDHETAAPDEQAQDIIGEEIQTEFSFSRNFNLPVETPVLTTETPLAEALNPVQEPAPLPPETQVPDLSLRKYPVYSVEDFIGSETAEPQTEAATEPEEPEAEVAESNTGGMDFLAWLSHPKPESVSATDSNEAEPESESEAEGDEPKPPLNEKTLDLIERFIQVNPQISRPKKEFFNAENMAKRSEVPDLEFVSETLANIYYEQGNYDMALKAYEKLSLQNPSKQAYFASLIEKIKSEKN